MISFEKSANELVPQVKDNPSYKMRGFTYAKLTRFSHGKWNTLSLKGTMIVERMRLWQRVLNDVCNESSRMWLCLLEVCSECLTGPPVA